jgi:aspartate racemase
VGVLGDAGAQLRRAGAKALLLATTTMHKVAAPATEAAGLPLLHIGDATGRAVRAAGGRRVGLLGTRFTIEDGFRADHLRQHHGVHTRVPDEADRLEVHRIIDDDLCHGIVRDESRQRYRQVMASLADRGCESMILGCTESALLTPPDHPPEPDGWPVPLFDTTALHAHEAMQWMLEETRP